MQKVLLILAYLISGSIASTAFAAAATEVIMKKASVDITDNASLQRGATLYMNNCAGCHSLDYLRYNRMAKDIGIVDFENNIDNARLQKDYIYTSATPSDPIRSAIDKKQAANWFGIEPPDLSLISRVRGADWLYTYLTSFYRDEARPFGSNNWLYPDVAMPNVLEYLQGNVIPRYKIETITYQGKEREIKKISDLQLLNTGKMDPPQFDRAVKDIVTFLVYAGEPMQLKRKAMGFWVIGFLMILAVFAYLLKKEYWKDINKK